jgi:hypothetical protein
MRSITGIFQESLGEKSNAVSGKAIRARQMEGDTGTFHYIDNLSRAIATAGEILLDLIPKVYSTPRTLRILGPDLKKVERIKVNQPTTIQEKGPDGQLHEIAHTYDLTVGKYDLTVSAGPSFTSRREEAAAQMIEFIRAYPQAAPIIGDLLAQNLDWPGADEVAERLKALLPAALQGESPEAQQMKSQIQKMAEFIGELKAENAALKADKAIDARKVEVDAFDAETNRLKAIVGKDGAPYDPAQMMPVVLSSLVNILNSPDILQMAQNGADPNQLGAMLAERLRRPPDEGEPTALVEPAPRPMGPPR